MKSLNKEIFRISIPAALETLFTTMASIIDSKMVSAMGLSAISAISVTNQPRLFVLCVFFSINITVSAMIAKHRGKQDRTGANKIALSALFLVLFAVVTLSCLSILFARPIMIICSNQPDTLEASILYFRIVMGGLIFNVVSMVINAMFRGCGHTHLTLISNTISCLINILLNHMLIGGNWGAPALGISGAAIATISAWAVSMIISITFALKKSNYINFHFWLEKGLRFTKECALDISSMWKKILAEDIFSRIGLLLTGIIAARAGSFAMSVYSVGMHLLNVNFALGSGLSAATVALIGRSYGAENMEEIRSYSRQILKIGTLASLVLTAIYIPFSKSYYGFFSDDPVFIKLGIISCIFIGIIAPIQTRQIVFNGMFRSIGDVKYTLFAAIISVTIINTSVSFIGTILLEGGIYGIWTGVLSAQTVRMLMLQHRYKHKIKEGNLL